MRRSRLGVPAPTPSVFYRPPTCKADFYDSRSENTASSSDADESQVMRHPRGSATSAVSAADIFAYDSTPNLIKKYLVYKLMGSDLFLNNSLQMMHFCYRVLGIRPTNFTINNSVGTLFTSGETLSTLLSDMAELRKQNIQSIANYAVEGLMTHDEDKILDFYSQTLATIEAQAALDQEGHAALKLTGLMSLSEMRRISSAQDTFLYGILALDELRSQDTTLTFDQF